MIKDENDQKTFNLIGELQLQELNTYWFSSDSVIDDDLKNIRMSVGWRNPQEDAYDGHSFRIFDQTDENVIQFLPEDGYCYGSIETQYYQVDGVA